MDVGQAIRASRIAGFNAEELRKTLQTFFAGTDTELSGYSLVTGKPPKPGKEAQIEWIVPFLSQAETRQRIVMLDQKRIPKIPSLEAFPLEKVEAMAEVPAGAPVLRVSAGVGGTPGLDVFGIAIPVSKAGAPQVRIYEGLAMKRDEVVTTVPGILDKASDGMVVLLRVRPHRDAELQVVLSDDRMKATVNYIPPAGDGYAITAEDVRYRIQKGGVVRGINETQLLQVMDHVNQGKALSDFEVAQGKLPAATADERVTFHAHLATGKASARRDGSVDFKAQDRISSVEKGELIATLLPLIAEEADGWDLTGVVKPVSAEVRLGLQAGRGVRADKDLEGITRFYAERSGELSREGAVLSVHESYTVPNDVDLTTGNVDFPGVIHVGGSIRSGFKVAAGQGLEVAQAVEAALVSAATSIDIGAGIKGEGRAVLRAGTDLGATFAEQATLVATGDVKLRESCVLCQVTCGGKLILETERGHLVGGRVRAYKGVVAQNIGSAVGVHTVVQFGEDFLLQEKFTRDQRVMDALQKKLTDLDTVLRQVVKAVEAAKTGGTGGGVSVAVPKNLREMQLQRRTLIKRVEEMKVSLAAMHEKLRQPVPATVEVRGTLFPGTILECRGKRYEVTTPKNMITLRFDPAQGKIVEAL